MLVSLSTFFLFANVKKPHTQAVNANPLVRRQMQHLALQREIVAFFGATKNAFAWWAHDLDAQVIQLKRPVWHVVCSFREVCR
jgi:hypothetical protein